MGQSIDIHYGKWDKIVKAYMDKGVKNKKLLIRILEACGLHMGNTYVILWADAWYEHNPMRVLLNLLDKYCPVENWIQFENDASEIFYEVTEYGDDVDCYDIEDKICEEFGLEKIEDD